jgi:sugar lactone lactonase YvrE
VAFSPDSSTIYCSDTRARYVIAFDVERRTRRTFDMEPYGHPDGMAIDEHGALWVALVSGGIGRFTPEGALDRRIEVPSDFVTSLCFSGTGLFVTADGRVLRTEVDVAGVPLTPAQV